MNTTLVANLSGIQQSQQVKVNQNVGKQTYFWSFPLFSFRRQLWVQAS